MNALALTEECTRRAARVLIVDDHQLLAQGLELGLRRKGLATVVTDSVSADAVLGAARTHRPDVVLLDLDLGDGGGSSLPLIQPLGDLGAVVLVLTAVTDRAKLGACIEQGAAGVASKAESFESILDKVQLATEGRSPVPLPSRQALLDDLREHRLQEARRRAPFEALSPREQAVLAGLLDGLAAEQIAETNYVSLATVRSQIQSILRKLGVNSQLAAVALARRAGWRPEQD